MSRPLPKSSSSASSSVSVGEKVNKPPRALAKTANNSTASANNASDSDSDEGGKDAAAIREEKLQRQREIIQQWQSRGSKRQLTSNVLFSSQPVKFKTVLRNTILDVFRQKGWKESDSETDWDIFWTNKEWIRCILDKVHLDSHQKVNHFRNFYELTRKDLLIKNLKKAKRTLQKKGLLNEAEQYFSFYPESFSLPNEYSLFVETYKKYLNSVFIMKPIGSSQGKGIFLFERLNQISEWKHDYYNRNSVMNGVNYNEMNGNEEGKGENNKEKDKEKGGAEKYIVQRYIANPLLIGGKKFDLRIYVLCLSYSPLIVYMYREGFARFSSTRYTNERKNIHDAYIHLTNVAIQKKGENYDSETGGKWEVRSLKLYLINRYGIDKVNHLFENISLICIRSLLAVQKVMIQDKNSFELYGYDILIDDQLKPWLIEVNASPSLTANTPADYQLKLALLHDTISVVDMEKKLVTSQQTDGLYNTQNTGVNNQSNTTSSSSTGGWDRDRYSPPLNYHHIGGFDLIYKAGHIYKPDVNCVHSSFLGAANTREHSLRELWKQIRKNKVPNAVNNGNVNNSKA
jgi:tubulin polyglutamylase TTLL9